MNPEQRDAFLQEPHTAVLATVDGEGRPHAVPVWYLWDGTSFVFIAGKNSAKVRHIAARGRAALCIDERQGRVQHVTAEGPATLGETATPEWRLALHTRYRGAEAAEEVVAAGGHEHQRFVTLTPERWYAWPQKIQD
ncbi:MAG: PPOX class F420-dependent oxidoreductase [Acidobacteriota bacterium]